MTSILFPLRTLKLALLILVGLLLIACYRRAEHFDDAWFAEQSYRFVHDGAVRSELFRGLNGWEDRIYVFHKLFIYAGALVMRLLGFSLAASKLLTTACTLLTGYLIWRYNRRASASERWLALVLYAGCGVLIRYAAVNRPEIMCMTLGFGSYLVLDRPDCRPPRPVWAGILAGLAALTHLNGIMYLIAGVGWLYVRHGWRLALGFSLAGGVTLSAYGLDALLDGRLPMLLDQFVNDPATQANFTLADKLRVMLNYQQLFFHSAGEVPLTVLVLLCLLVFRRHVRLTQPVLLYLTLLFVGFWLLTKSIFNFYYLLFVPWLVILAADYLTTYLPAAPRWYRQAGRVLLIGYYGFALFNLGSVFVENGTVPYVPDYNRQLARQMPQHHVKIIAPISFFFGQADQYAIRGLSYYSVLSDRQPLPLRAFFELADRDGIRYVVSDGYLNASYIIPLNAPARIGAYHLIFRDNMTSVYERQ